MSQTQGTTAGPRPTATVTLQTPIERKGSDPIATLQLMKPRTGDLRGLMLAEVLQMKTDAIAALLPRISVPTILKHEVDELDPADLVTIAVEVAGFLVPKAAMDSLAA